MCHGVADHQCKIGINDVWKGDCFLSDRIDPARLRVWFLIPVFQPESVVLGRKCSHQFDFQYAC
jgi:hypothetical protein